jgi:F-type H+-transporting ATPase subunit epsilon
VILPSRAGEICILARHAPLLAQLRPGLVRLKTQFDEAQELFVSSGYAEVQPHSVTLLADTVMRSDDIDEAAAQAAVERTRSALATHPAPADYERLKAELHLELALLRAIDDLRKRPGR